MLSSIRPARAAVALFTDVAQHLVGDSGADFPAPAKYPDTAFPSERRFRPYRAQRNQVSIGRHFHRIAWLKAQFVAQGFWYDDPPRTVQSNRCIDSGIFEWEYPVIDSRYRPEPPGPSPDRSSRNLTD
jgi:hypothetical protein